MTYVGLLYEISMGIVTRFSGNSCKLHALIKATQKPNLIIKMSIVAEVKRFYCPITLFSERLNFQYLRP